MRAKNLVLGVGIFVVYMLMLSYGIEAFYASPKYDDYCEVNRKPILEGFNETSGESVRDDESCYREYDKANVEYGKVVFLVALVAGIATLLAGYFFFSIEPVGSALIASGVGAIFYGSARNWQNFSDIWRFLLLVFAFVLLVWMTLRMNKLERKRR